MARQSVARHSWEITAQNMELGTHTWLIEVFGTSFIDENLQTRQLHIQTFTKIGVEGQLFQLQFAGAHLTVG